MKNYINLIWGGDWFIENENAWFIDVSNDMLCYIKLTSGKYECIAEIPDTNLRKSLLNKECIKVGNEILCLPCYGDKIWIYDLISESFQYIELENHNYGRIILSCGWKYDDKIFSVSFGLKEALLIDIDKRKITYYTISLRERDIDTHCLEVEPAIYYPPSMADEFSSCVKVGTKIYCVSYRSNKIHQFDLDTKQTKVYIISDINEGFTTICFDGCKFWMSGYSKKIYVWDENNNKVKIIENFPEGFGIYKISEDTEELIDTKLERYDMPTFVRLAFVGKYIWAIPRMTNNILYIDKDTFEIHILIAESEKETKESLQRIGLFRYIWQYVRDDRYIGLFSRKDNRILEIDTIKWKVELKNYFFDDNYLKILYGGQILTETEDLVFDRLVTMESGNKVKNSKASSIGKAIYNQVKNFS